LCPAFTFVGPNGTADKDGAVHNALQRDMDVPLQGGVREQDGTGPDRDGTACDEMAYVVHEAAATMQGSHAELGSVVHETAASTQVLEVELGGPLTATATNTEEYASLGELHEAAATMQVLEVELGGPLTATATNTEEYASLGETNVREEANMSLEYAEVGSINALMAGRIQAAQCSVDDISTDDKHDDISKHDDTSSTNEAPSLAARDTADHLTQESADVGSWCGARERL